MSNLNKDAECTIDTRHKLSLERINSIANEFEGQPDFKDYFEKMAEFLLSLEKVRTLVAEGTIKNLDIADLKKNNQMLYGDILPDNYETSYANPTYATKKLTDKYGQVLCLLYAELRSGIFYAFENKQEYLTILNELFLQVCGCFEREELPEYAELKDIIYWYASDYCDVFVTGKIQESIRPEYTFANDIINNSDLNDLKYLYYFGEYVSDNVIKTAKHIAALPYETIKKMADVYTEGYKQGFINEGKDLSIKSTVNVIYPLGFEKVVKEAMINFKEMGLDSIFFRDAGSVISKRPIYVNLGTAANKQYDYDHRFDQGLFMDKKYIDRKLDVLKNTYENNKEIASKMAGPAVKMIFGEVPFAPLSKDEAIGYSDEQKKLSLEYDNKSGMINNEYIKGEERSFTIIAYPVPDIGEDFNEIFDETIKINTLDVKLYEKIQKTLIDVLDKGEYVNVLGGGNNRTNLRVSLQKLKNPEKETLFANCLADVNIPVGEVFTSPMLEGTKGILHIDKVYLDGMQYYELELTFEDGMITDYTCENFDDLEENKKFIVENLFSHHPSLPISEFAIGTNTTAFAMAEKYNIIEKLPILIIEKMGPHFAIGDTCYKWSEDLKVYNPDGKEIQAKDNSISIKRKEDPSKAYYQCHTDITIPYYDLKEISVVTYEGEKIMLIENGRFVLPGTEILNEPLDSLS